MLSTPLNVAAVGRVVRQIHLHFLGEPASIIDGCKLLRAQIGFYYNRLCGALRLFSAMQRCMLLVETWSTNFIDIFSRRDFDTPPETFRLDSVELRRLLRSGSQGLANGLSRFHVQLAFRPHVSKALGATASTTTKLAIINAVATNVTIKIVPLEAGNLPRIT